MSSELLPVWKEIAKYIDEGISVIPVRDKDDAGGVAKSPFGSWKTAQRTITDKAVLFDLMDIKYNTTAVGIVGGKVSGNLEIIDIDVKYKPGIDATLFTDLKTLYPDLLSRLRIHKSPSGGYHILYRCETSVPGNQKLAGRKGDNGKPINFIETRGEGGYVLAPPSLGYRVIKDIPIPMLTAIDRESIVGLCRSYNEIVKIEKPPAPAPSDIQYYDTNPFEDFNNRCDPTELATSQGWSVFKFNSNFIWYTRPGKGKGVSMSFNLSKRFFFCFTASTELEENHGYSPANLLSALQFRGDKKRLYAHLVSEGYGKIKPAVEARLVKKAALNGTPLPPNASPEATTQREQLVASLDEQHPFGIFWIDGAEGVVIDRELLYRVAEGLGFKLHNSQLTQVTGGYLDTITDRYFFDTIKYYIHEGDADLYRDICNAYEAFIEKHGKFTISRLPMLPDEAILRDTKDAAYKCYENGILKITANHVQLLAVSDKLIWRKSVHTRQYTNGEGGRYVEYLKLATEYSDYLLQCIGYLAHEFKDETAGYIIVLTEECENPKDGGGAGKNVFSELFKHITSFVAKPGTQVKYDEKFMQSWNYEKIFCLSDVPKNFNFSFLKELSTGTGLMKKLFKDEKDIASADMPKFLVSSNYSIEITDGGLKRRVKMIEFTDFFTRCGGIDMHFGTHFPNEWNEGDWAGFDTLMAHAVQKWLQGNRKIGVASLSASGWAKQFEQTWGQVIYHFIKENFDEWVRSIWVSNTVFATTLEKYYSENNIPKIYQPSMVRINSAIKDFCLHHSVGYGSDLSHRGSYMGIDGINTKHRRFGEEDLPF